jgi:hypothetical protein
MEARFKSYVAQTPTETGCLLWTGYTHEGRGFFSVNGKPKMAHRVSYTLAKGEIPEGQCVRHTCDVPLCVNPEHLLLGTHQDNMTDMKDRNRRKGTSAVQGEAHGCAKLTEAQVRQILASSKARNDIAREFGVSPSTIKGIRTGRLWKHLGSTQ